MNSISDWIEQSPAILIAVLLVSFATFLITLIGVGWVILRLPEDYLRQKKKSSDSVGNPLIRFLLKIARNLLGLAFLIGGTIMLFTPGQGVLSIVVGLMLTDLPGKRKWIRRILGHPKVLASINRIRQKAGKKPLQAPDNKDLNSTSTNTR